MDIDLKALPFQLLFCFNKCHRIIFLEKLKFQLFSLKHVYSVDYSLVRKKVSLKRIFLVSYKKWYDLTVKSCLLDGFKSKEQNFQGFRNICILKSLFFETESNFWIEYRKVCANSLQWVFLCFRLIKLKKKHLIQWQQTFQWLPL